MDDLLDFELENIKKPFRNFVISCTGFNEEQRSEIYDKAQQLGAITSADLTSKVTHLVTNRIGTEKYRYAVEYFIPIMSLEWVTHTHKLWIAGDDINMSKIARVFSFPPFYGLRVCCTGLTAVEREYIAHKVKEFGGTHSPDFTKRCTHLIADKPQGKKYETALKWNTKVVRVEWFEHSLKMEVCLDESLYSLDKDPPKMPINIRKELFKANLIKRKVTNMNVEEIEQARLKLRRRNSSLDVVDLINEHKETLTLLQKDSIARMGPTTPRKGSDGPYQEQSMLRKRSDSPSQEQSIFKKRVDSPSQEQSMLKKRVDSPSQEQSTLRKRVSSPSQEQSTLSRVSSTVEENNNMVEEGIFGGMIFMHYGFSKDQGEILQNEIIKLGGRIEIETKPFRYVIVPFNGGMYNSFCGETVVTERWIEGCLNRERICHPDEHFIYTPWRKPIPILERANICTTGFDDLEKREIKILVLTAGGKYSETFSKENTHLLCKIGSGEKFKRAQKRFIPCLNEKWLFDSVQIGILVDYSTYIIHPITKSIEIREKEKREFGKSLENSRKPLSPLSKAMSKSLFRSRGVGMEIGGVSGFIYDIESQESEESVVTYDDSEAQRERDDLISLLKEKRLKRLARGE